MPMVREGASFTMIASAMHARSAEMSARIARVGSAPLVSLRFHDVRSSHACPVGTAMSVGAIDRPDVVLTSITRAI